MAGWRTSAPHRTAPRRSRLSGRQVASCTRTAKIFRKRRTCHVGLRARTAREARLEGRFDVHCAEITASQAGTSP